MPAKARLVTGAGLSHCEIGGLAGSRLHQSAGTMVFAGPLPGHYDEKAIFILTGGFNQAIRHSRRSGNPEPFLRRHAHGNWQTPGVGKQRSSLPSCHTAMPWTPALTYYEKAIFILTGGFNQAIRHSRRSGNPEPLLCADTLMVTGKCQV